jgi:2-polyprenyl-6-methoxyphenol hydroxylase-like FAD-dependent oxidoreductase
MRARIEAAMRCEAVFCFTAGVLVHRTRFIDTSDANAYTARMHILISGSSIAGPALAYWLHTYGIDVTVVERAPSLRLGGYFVDIRGVALEVVARMGLREALRPLEADTLANAMVDARGRRFGRTDRGFGVIDPDDIEVRRGDLSRVLYDATRAVVDYRFADSIAAITPHATGVVVDFAGGTTETFDAVIGADGVHSRTRALAFGPESDFVRPMGTCMAVFTAPNHLGLDREQLLFTGLGRIASIKSSHDNRRLDLALFFDGAPDAFDARDVASQRRLVADAFGATGWEFPRFIEAMRSADDFYCDLTCQVRMDAFHAGRVALVGDAAYCPSPATGQGTSLALVGAYVLATELARHSEPVTAFRRYDAALRGFVQKNQDIALKIGTGMTPRTAFEVCARRVGMKLMPHVPGSQLVMKLAMRGIQHAARAFELPPPVPSIGK